MLKVYLAHRGDMGDCLRHLITRPICVGVWSWRCHCTDGPDSRLIRGPSLLRTAGWHQNSKFGKDSVSRDKLLLNIFNFLSPCPISTKSYVKLQSRPQFRKHWIRIHFHYSKLIANRSHLKGPGRNLISSSVNATPTSYAPIRTEIDMT
jgi:hypothetical protein